MKVNFRIVCLFWGFLDVFYIFRFVWINMEQGRVPFVNDFSDFTQLFDQHDGLALAIFLLSLLLNVSIVFSAVLLLAGWKKVRSFIITQLPFRLLLAVPSLSFTPWLLKELHFNSIFVFLVALIISELLKYGSFAWVKNEGEMLLKKVHNE